MSKREQWDERYRSVDLVWGAGPNRFLVEELGSAEPPGRVLDLACGEGRNALWLAERGFAVTAVDFSAVAIERAKKLAAERGVAVAWVCADVTSFEPAPGGFERVVIFYLQLPRADFSRVLGHAARALAPGGELLLIGHALRNRTEGVGGPQQDDVLWDPPALRRELEGLGLEVDSAEEVLRPVEDKGSAIDARIRARRAA